MSEIAAQREAKLQECIEELYATFGTCRLRPYIEPDPCFPSFCDDGPLRAAPLRQLPYDAFHNYSWKAMTTWGSVEDFKHFLPRLLELIVPLKSSKDSRDGSAVQLAGFEPYLVSSKLRYGQWRHWLAREQSAIENFFRAHWGVICSRACIDFPSVLHPPSALCWLSLIAHAEDSLVKYLESWEADMQSADLGFQATLHLAGSIGNDHYPFINVDEVLSPDYEQLDAQNVEVAEWIFSDRIFQLMEEAYFRWQDTPEAQHFSQAHHWLDLLRQELRWKRSLSPDEA